MPFELQGHRGARGLKPENTLPSFEAALDVGASSIETDVQLTKDGVVVIAHDFEVTESLFQLRCGGVPDPAAHPSIRDLTFDQLRHYSCQLNPDPKRFPEQKAVVTLVAGQLDIDPWAPPSLAELFQFAKTYSQAAGKTPEQQEWACRLIFDVEVKRFPFRQHEDGIAEKVVEVIRAAGVVGRTRVRSFDHRVVRRVVELEPAVEGAVLISGTAPVDAAALVRQAGSRVYCPDHEFLDEPQVRQLQAEGFRVIPWTVNDPADWDRLLDWGVDGITTDFPDRLAAKLRARGQNC